MKSLKYKRKNILFFQEKEKKIENKTNNNYNKFNNLNTNKNKENTETENSCININTIYSNCSNFNLLFIIKLLGNDNEKYQKFEKSCELNFYINSSALHP